MYPIHDFGGQAQRQQCLPQMSLGTLIDCLGLTEPHDGSRPANMKTHTKRRGGDYLSNGAKVFEDQAMGPLCAQRLIETFAESAEPLCRADPEADPADEIVTLEEFLERWAEG